MYDIKYHPLIDADSSGTEKVPLFAVRDEEMVREHHKLWLEEISTSDFWLHSKEPMKEDAVNELQLHCPNCGNVMKSLGPPLDEHRLSLYYCENCSKRKEGKK